MKENSCPRLFFHLKFNWYLVRRRDVEFKRRGKRVTENIHPNLHDSYIPENQSQKENKQKDSVPVLWKLSC